MENKKTILLVDDEVKITQVLTAYLEKAGYQTVCAHDGKEASRLLQSQSFSLIILDLMLPDISGESLCRTIRTHYRTPVTPHQLRHTYITNLIHASVDPKTVQYLAGHESSKITMDIYAKVKYNRPDELVRSMSGAFTSWEAV